MRKKEKKAPVAKPATGKKAKKSPIEKKTTGRKESVKKKVFPTKFPFWARLKIGKKRTTLVIDEDVALNRPKKKVEGFVHREATHTPRKDYEEIKPNPDKTDPKPMYLKRPQKKPKTLFEPHNKDLDMPKDLQKRYEQNNSKNKR